MRKLNVTAICSVAAICSTLLWLIVIGGVQNAAASSLSTSTEGRALIYRLAENPVGSFNAIAFSLKGNSLPGSITIIVMASNGQAGSALPVVGSGKDPEPLWPAWISSNVSTDFAGWRNIVIPFANLQYRPPIGTSGSPTATLSNIDTFGIASSNRNGVVYIRDLTWESVDNTGTLLPGSAPIDDFKADDVSAWKIKGSPEAVDNLIASISVSPAATASAESLLKLDYSSLSARRAVLLRTVASAMTRSGRSYAVSVPLSPFDRIFPDTLPEESELLSTVSLEECADQTESGSFAIYSKTGLTDVSVHLSTGLNSVLSSIPSSSVNIYVVKVWDRQGTELLTDPDESGPVPELLVKDDRVPLSCNAGQPPDVRLAGDPVTDIPAGTEKQFWIDVSVPRNTPTGRYTAQLVVKSAETAPFTISLETTVLPIRLLSPSKQYIINYRGKIGPNVPANSLPSDILPPPLFQAELADIWRHDVHYVALSDGPTDLPSALSLESQFNFQSPIFYPVQSGPDGLAAAKAIAKLSTDPYHFYFFVPSGPTLAKDVAKLNAAGLQPAALIDNDGDYDSVGNNLDVAVYPIDYHYVQDLIRTDGKRQNLTRDWLTWPVAQANPQLDRLYSGYLLWRSNLYGAFISDYQTSLDDNPYDDTLVPTENGFAPYRPAMLTYPAQQGVIDTIQWESLREGIDDVRYLTTYYAAMRECKDAKIDLDVVSQSLTDVTNFLNRDFWTMSDTDYENGRAMIARYAVTLRLAVDGYNRRHSSSM